MNDDEVRAELTKFKASEANKDVDWDTHEVYAIVNEVSREIERMGVVRKDRMMGYFAADQG